MNGSEARELYQAYVETIYHRREVERLGEFFSEDIIPHPVAPGMAPGLEGMKAVMRGWLAAFSDMRMSVDAMVFEGDTLAVRLDIHAVHTGPFAGVPATGRRVHIAAHPHYQMRGGRIVRYWDMPDTLTLLQQLGAFPTGAQG